MARLSLSGQAASEFPDFPGRVKMLADGFEFTEGICNDSKGNIYFCELRLKRIYKWSVETNSIELLADYPWEPLSLAYDSKDNLLVVFRYDPQFGYLVNGEQERFTNPPDAGGTSSSMWGNSGFTTLACSVVPDNPDETLKVLQVADMGEVKKVFKALYPSTRWRDYHDFDKIVMNRNEKCFLAPDSVTIIPICYDLARSCSLAEAFPGKKTFISDEYDKRTVQLDVDQSGYLSNLKHFAEKGEFSSIPGPNGDVYVAYGDICIFDKAGNNTGSIRLPERPSSIAFGGKDMNTLFITGRRALYSLEVGK
jgi:hypothetical protein